MWNCVTIRVSDLDASIRFYETVLGRRPWHDFSIAQADAEHPPTRHLHVAFAAESRADVDRFWRAGVDAGYESDGEPGLRPQYDENYYGAFLLDPDGNSAEVCCGFREPGSANLVDHLWIGVADLPASKRFWGSVAPALGLRIVDRGERVQVVARNRSFALVADGRPLSENVHLALPVPGDDTVVEVHLNPSR